jgi:hypothetical protein
MDNDRLNRIEDKLDKITDKLQEMNVTLAENTQSLIIHEKRTDLAERKIELVQLQLNEQLEKDHKIIEKIEEKLLPIQTHVNLVNVVFKYIIPSIAGLIAFLYKVGIVKF